MKKAFLGILGAMFTHPVIEDDETKISKQKYKPLTPKELVYQQKMNREKALLRKGLTPYEFYHPDGSKDYVIALNQKNFIRKMKLALNKKTTWLPTI